LQVTYLFPIIAGRELTWGNVFRSRTCPAIQTSPPDAVPMTPTPEIMKTRKFANMLLHRSFHRGRLVSVRRMLGTAPAHRCPDRARQAELAWRRARPQTASRPSCRYGRR
jgi:hypothetical protein